MARANEQADPAQEKIAESLYPKPVVTMGVDVSQFTMRNVYLEGTQD